MSRKKHFKASRCYPFKLTKQQLKTLRKFQNDYISARTQSNKTRFSSYRGTLDKLRRDASTDSWTINGVEHARQDIMFKVLDWVSDGNPLKMFCDQAGAPSIGTIYKWFKNHPEFERDFRAAEEAGGHSLGDQALIEAIKLTEKDEVAIVKLKYDAMTRRAAQMNQKFQDKQVFRQEDDIKTISSEELMKRKEELIQRVKGELEMQGWIPPKEEKITVVKAEEEDKND